MPVLLIVLGLLKAFSATDSLGLVVVIMEVDMEVDEEADNRMDMDKKLSSDKKFSGHKIYLAIKSHNFFCDKNQRG